MAKETESVEFEIGIDDFGGSYTWGLGDRDHFLHGLELEIRGTITAGPTGQGQRALVKVVTDREEEPSSHDKEQFKEIVAIGRVEVGKLTLRAHAVVARSGVLSMLELLKSNKTLRLFITCTPLQTDSLGEWKCELLRLWLSAGY